MLRVFKCFNEIFRKTRKIQNNKKISEKQENLNLPSEYFLGFFYIFMIKITVHLSLQYDYLLCHL